MKKNNNKLQTYRLKLLLLLLPFIVVVAGCSQEKAQLDDNSAETTTSEGVEADAINFTDDTGREVSIKAPVEEMIALQPSDVEIIYALGAEDALVAVGEYTDYPQEATELPVLGSGMNMNVEEIISQAPELVIIGHMAGQEEMYDALEEAGIAVAVFQDETIDEVYETIELYGKILDAKQNAETLIHEMQMSFNHIGQLSDEQETPGSVYYETSPLEFGLWTAGSHTFLDDIGHLLNLENTFNDLEGFVEVSEEQVMERQPAYIVTTTVPMEGHPAPDEEITQRPGWKTIPAVENQDVLIVDGSKVTRPGPRLVEAAEDLYEAIYGESASTNTSNKETIGAN